MRASHEQTERLLVDFPRHTHLRPPSPRRRVPAYQVASPLGQSRPAGKGRDDGDVLLHWPTNPVVDGAVPCRPPAHLLPPIAVDVVARGNIRDRDRTIELVVTTGRSIDGFGDGERWTDGWVCALAPRP